MLPARSGLYGHNWCHPNRYIDFDWHWHRQCSLDCLGDRRLWIVGDSKHVTRRSFYGLERLRHGWNADGGYAWSRVQRCTTGK